MHRVSDYLRVQNITIGFVPTMGYLHEGHLSLVKQSKKSCRATIVSIFVNPAQFGPNEDFDRYPRDTNRDLALLEKEGVDYVFLPEAGEIYPDGYQTYVEVTEISKKHEGEFRPNHFKGVTTVVSILFNIVKPQMAFFGQKDAQQVTVLKRMVKDLKYNIEVIACPTLREPDGLAMSSRNIYLDETQRNKALLLSKSLIAAEKLVESGERDALTLVKAVNNFFLKETSVHLNYIRLVDSDDFIEPKKIEAGKEYYILIACKIGGTRLIDNLFLKVPV